MTPTCFLMCVPRHHWRLLARAERIRLTCATALLVVLGVGTLNRALWLLEGQTLMVSVGCGLLACAGVILAQRAVIAMAATPSALSPSGDNRAERPGSGRVPRRLRIQWLLCGAVTVAPTAFLAGVAPIDETLRSSEEVWLAEQRAQAEVQARGPLAGFERALVAESLSAVAGSRETERFLRRAERSLQALRADPRASPRALQAMEAYERALSDTLAAKRALERPALERLAARRRQYESRLSERRATFAANQFVASPARRLIWAYSENLAPWGYWGLFVVLGTCPVWLRLKEEASEVDRLAVLEHEARMAAGSRDMSEALAREWQNARGYYLGARE